MSGKGLDIGAIRARLENAPNGREYWRSLEELAETEEFQAYLRDEFPRQTAPWLDKINRRDFLKLMGASLALAGLAGCQVRPPTGEFVPYVYEPERMVPGRPLFFATATTMGGYALGLLAESHEGRPTKVEGNPDHPASLGATDAFAQASILTLYDPDRSQVVNRNGQISTWESFIVALRDQLEAQRASRGAGLRVLTETVTSPTLASQMDALQSDFPELRWHQYQPVGRDNVVEGAQIAFGEAVETRYRFERADVVLALDADFLYSFPGSVRYARDFSQRRRVRGEGTAQMSRLYSVESSPTITGAKADHRQALQARQVQDFARSVARRLGVDVEAPEAGTLGTIPDAWIDALVSDLQANAGACIIVPGDEQPPVVHALAHAMNFALGNAGNTVLYTDPVVVEPANQTESLRELVADMEAGNVEVLIIIDSNPVYTAPADLDFGQYLRDVPFAARLGLYEDETSRLCNWHIPATHYLEAWSDARAFDGAVTIMQPLIAPLYDGKSVHELLAAMLGDSSASSHDVVRGYWQGRVSGDFNAFWQQALHEGVVDGTRFEPRAVELLADLNLAPMPAQDTAGLEIIFRPDPSVWDGRLANNAWLQELPKPLTKLTWDNAALISPSTAERLALANEEVVELRYNGRSVRAPIWILPGHADASVTVHLGYGRTFAGSIARGQGFNAYLLRTADNPWFGSGLEIAKTGDHYRLARTQHHHSMEGRDLVRAGTLEQFRQNPNFPQHVAEKLPSLYPDYEYPQYAWGMSIDLTACIGCNACVIACQAENNIPTVGKEQVIVGREMQWIRIDRYYKGDLDNPATFFEPVPCMQCEKAPCEPVCPVGATLHTSEGLNAMVYNRCVGTRYCSNNCPYKVRRFNFLQFADFETESLKLMRNPDVTTRQRGVMEKCTYCVQRISAARIEAKKQGRRIRDGEIKTACQQVCPAQAIVFGDINDPDSAVRGLKGQPHNFSLLAELNTRPRTTYLPDIRNVNAEIEGS